MLTEIISKRRSVFPSQYTVGEIPRADLEQILDSAKWAPTHKKTQPWRFKVLQGEVLDQLGHYLASSYENTEGFKNFKLNKLREKPSKAAAIVLIFMHRCDKESVPEWEEIAATAMAVQNMWLTSHDLGYGAYWSSPKSFAPMDEWDAIEVGEREQFLGFFYIGNYNKEDVVVVERKGVEEYTQFYP